MSDLFIPGQTIGIIGGGHQARLLTLSAKSMGFHVGILDPDEWCSASEIADWHIVADTNRQSALMNMAAKCDLLTFSNENINTEFISNISDFVTISQSLELIEISQNRVFARSFLENSNINIAPYVLISEFGDIEDSVDAIGFPCVLKSSRYMWEGSAQQYVLNDMSDIRNCLPLLQEDTCILEAQITDKIDISVTIVGNGNGDYVKFPVVETVYKEDGSFVRATVPASIPPEVSEEAQRIAEELAMILSVQGLLTVNLFVTSSGLIYVNSISSGPHCSGYYSMEASNLSQFDAHIRGIAGWKLPDISLYTPAITLNIAGNQSTETISCIPFNSNWYHHYYGNTAKEQADSVGHVTILTEDVSDELQKIKKTRIWDDSF